MIKGKVTKALLALAIILIAAVSCATQGPAQPQVLDYASQVKLDMSSPTLKQAVTVKTFVDGDTTHFFVPTSLLSSGVLKARYIAINTPESTGKIEQYGKAASNFTKEKLSNASSIVIESDSAQLDADSTGGRYLVWVWYRNSESEEYRNLNIEILQNGLAIASSSANNRYGATCVAAINQAKEQGMNIYSGIKDPDFYYGSAVELTLKELRCNISDYNGVKVAFEGVVTRSASNTVYVEEYDPDTDMYYGMTVYYGYGLSGEGLDVLSVGNRARIVGTVQYYEAGGTYQVSGLTYSAMRPDSPDNIKKLGDGFVPAYVPTEPVMLNSATVAIADDEGNVRFWPYAELAMNTSLSMTGLQVKSIHTTSDEESSSYGAMSMTCEKDGQSVTVRTAVMYENGSLVTQDAYEGRTIDVFGLVDYFNGSYQIKVFSPKDIVITR